MNNFSINFFLTGILYMLQLIQGSDGAVTFPYNCTILDRESIEKQFINAMEKAVERKFKGEYRKRSAEMEQVNGIHPNESAKNTEILKQTSDDIHVEKVNSGLKDIVPVDWERHHEQPNVNITEYMNGEAILSRNKRFCIPFSYSDDVKLMVRKVVMEALKDVKF